MIGTIANTGSILLGSLIGGCLRKGIREKYRLMLNDAMGLCVTALGIRTITDSMPDSKYPVLFIVSMALGGLIGTALSLDTAFEKAVSKLPLADSELARGLSTAILLFCAGTLSILGPIRSALFSDHTYLFTNAMLDGITSAVLASNFGIGIALAAAVLFLWQGSIYVLAGLIAPYVTETLMTEISIIGGLLIFASGLGILGIKQIKTMNLLPALLIPVLMVPFLSAWPG